MNKILIITTEGCEACRIAKNNVDNAVAQSSADINVVVKDFHEFNQKEQKAYKLNDYPVTLYFVDTKLVCRAVGTYPSPVYLRWIDMYFKN